MLDPNNLCLGCMNELEEENRTCKICGWNNEADENKTHQLKCGTVLQGKYLIGKVLGEGGFGITYLGFDLLLQEKVAIKEFYPHGFVGREITNGLTVEAFDGKEAFVNKSKDAFIKEAKTMSNLNKVEGIVEMKDVFSENQSVYIVMEYVEGQTLKDYVKQNGNKLPMSTVLKLLEPVMDALEQIHAHNLIHRDISPDNIMVGPDGRVTLLDLGAARQISADGGHSLTVNVKHGYAPMEQYQTHGEQGPWTDIYALCATIYRLITGKVAPSAADRALDDSLIKPSVLGADITEEQERVLLKGLAVRSAERYLNVFELKNAFNGTESEKKKTEDEEKVRLQGIYDSAKAKMAENKIKSYEQAIEIFRSISAFEDSENQIYFCQGKIEELKVKEAEEKLERERKAELKKIADQKRRENAKRLAKIWTPIVAGVLAFAILLNFVVIPNFDYIKAEINTMVEEAKAEKAEKETAKAEEDKQEEIPPEENHEEPEEEISGEEKTAETVPLFKAKVGDVITFGSYEQDNNTSNGKEDIEWLVLEVKDGKALVISKYALDCKQYNTRYKEDVTWETCTLRKWLNNDFIDAAFSADEKAMIPTVTVSADKNPEYSTNPGNATQDQVFLLSITEANKYFSSDSARQCEPTDFAVANGAWESDSGNCWWWLRSPGDYRLSAAAVYHSGDVLEGGYGVNYDFDAVRPAMWINISDFGETSAEEKRTVPLSEATVGDYVIFGSYEQDNNLENGAEPIEWQVLDVQDGKALVVSRFVLDSKEYQVGEELWTEATWELCSLREWLNDDFLESSFSLDEQSIIILSELENSDSYSGADGGNNTEDKIFLLSIDEAERYFKSEYERDCWPTAYAKANNVFVGYGGNAWWWLRSVGGNNGSAARVISGGFIDKGGFNIWETVVGVRPAMWIDISDM